MEQITKKNGEYYYGSEKCLSADNAYNRFRDDYHRGIGREFYHRLNQYGRRVERIHGRGFVFSDPSYLERLADKFRHTGRVRTRLLGLVGIHYCWMIGDWDLPEIEEEDSDEYFDWLLGKGTGALYKVGIKQKAGRTSKRLNKRY